MTLILVEIESISVLPGPYSTDFMESRGKQRCHGWRTFFRIYGFLLLNAQTLVILDADKVK